jgi:hypothetical protein
MVTPLSSAGMPRARPTMFETSRIAALVNPSGAGRMVSTLIFRDMPDFATCVQMQNAVLPSGSTSRSNEIAESTESLSYFILLASRLCRYVLSPCLANVGKQVGRVSNVVPVVNELAENQQPIEHDLRALRNADCLKRGYSPSG